MPLLSFFAIPPGFFRRSLKASVIYGLLATLFTIVYAPGHFGTGLRYFYFLSWMLINLVVWSAGVRELLGKRRPVIIFSLINVKIFWILVLVITCQTPMLDGFENFLTFLLGINTPFLVMFLKVCGKLVTRKLTLD
jgi:hypothetical protein